MTTRSIPWPRILAEGFAIVVSILLAFGIQAWWEGAGEQEEEQRLLAALMEETQLNLIEIDDNIRRHEDILTASQTLLFLPLSPTVPIPSDSLDQLIWHLNWTSAADFQTATLNSILLGGRLAVITSPELRQRITEWRGALDEIADIAYHDFERDVERLRAYLRQHASIAQLSSTLERVPGSTEPFEQLYPIPEPLARRDHRELLRQPEFRNILLQRRFSQEDLLHSSGGYPGLRAALVRLMEVLEAELALGQ